MERLPPSAIATLAPGYFAMVMATGIIAIGADQQGIGWLASALYVVAVIAYGVLGGLLGVRIVRYRQAFVADLTDHMRGFSFLTVVAGTNVLAAASAVVHGWWNAAWVLWWIGNALWVVLVYSTLIAVVVSDHKPALGAGINGSWFLLTVATQSVAVVAALLLARSANDLLAFVAIGAFTLGIMLYVIVMTMVFLRWTFHALEPSEADPPAWIAAGAVAISVLAGSNLLLARDTSPRIARIAPFLEGMVMMVWATATFWFPLMIAVGVWRHLVRRIPLRYHPSYWALVFPLGMYAAATYRMNTATGIDFLDWLPKLALAGALVAWSATFTGLLHQGLRATARRLR